MVKFLISIVVIAAVIGGLWWSGWLGKLGEMLPFDFMKPAAETATTTPQVAEEQVINDLPTAANDASDQALEEDAAAIDVQMQALVSESADADASLSDKSVSQEY